MIIKMLRPTLINYSQLSRPVRCLHCRFRARVRRERILRPSMKLCDFIKTVRRGGELCIGYDIAANGLKHEKLRNVKLTLVSELCWYVCHRHHDVVILQHSPTTITSSLSEQHHSGEFLTRPKIMTPVKLGTEAEFPSRRELCGLLAVGGLIA